MPSDISRNYDERSSDNPEIAVNTSGCNITNTNTTTNNNNNTVKLVRSGT
jgi:hypothetical protein